MDLSKYEKIDGREALDRMDKGDEVYDRSGIKFRKIFGEIKYTRTDGAFKATDMPINTFLFEEDWYVLKPFDVRQAMRDKPDEWVGVYQDNDGRSYKVGFDTNRFLAVETELESDASVANDFSRVRGTSPENLERCTPIEDASVNVNK